MLCNSSLAHSSQIRRFLTPQVESNIRETLLILLTWLRDPFSHYKLAVRHGMSQVWSTSVLYFFFVHRTRVQSEERKQLPIPWTQKMTLKKQAQEEIVAHSTLKTHKTKVLLPHQQSTLYATEFATECSQRRFFWLSKVPHRLVQSISTNRTAKKLNY